MAENEKAPARDTRGAQVHLTGDAVIAARGGFGESIEENVLVRDALIADGEVASGLTTDGKTDTGKAAADPVVTVEGKPGGEVPADSPTPPKPVPKTTKGR